MTVYLRGGRYDGRVVYVQGPKPVVRVGSERYQRTDEKTTDGDRVYAVIRYYAKVDA